jgi:Holliday junction resolvasome RuvABC endonuclease subunit
MTHCILGIDPGISGAIAFYFPDVRDRVLAEDMPTVAGNVDAATLHERLKQLAPTVAVIEMVASRPGQGVASVFKFGRAYGTAIGVVQALGVQLHFVTPGKWKKHFNLPADKEKARELALRMFSQSPEHFARKKDDGRAEAALLALYGAETILTRAAA